MLIPNNGNLYRIDRSRVARTLLTDGAEGRQESTGLIDPSSDIQIRDLIAYKSLLIIYYK
jgi:hypothetical protein